MLFYIFFVFTYKKNQLLLDVSFDFTCIVTAANGYTWQIPIGQ